MSVLVFASFSDRFWKPFFFIFGFALGALGGQQVTANVIENRCERWHQKKRFMSRSGHEKESRVGDQEGGKAGAKPSPWGFGSTEEKKQRKKEGEKGKEEIYEGLEKEGVYTP